LASPDIVFRAIDLGVNGNGIPFTLARSAGGPGTPGWLNNSALYVGSGLTAGPGQYQSPVSITFNKVGPWRINDTSTFMGQENAISIGFLWGSFDGTTNPPTVYPYGSSIEALTQQVLSGQ
jgi:hypothetical protein